MAEVEIYNLEIEHDWAVWLELGMRVTLDVVVEKAPGRVIEVGGRFYDKEMNPLKDENRKYFDRDGNVASVNNFNVITNPDDISARFELPYPELHLGPGEHEVLMQLEIWIDPGPSSLPILAGDPIPFRIECDTQGCLHSG